MRLEHDARGLEFEPPGSRDQLWRALTYLEGVDLKDSPSSYLHVPDDFRRFCELLGL